MAIWSVCWGVGRRGSYTWQCEKVYNLAVRGEKTVKIEERSLAQCQGWLSKCLKLITIRKGSQEMRGRVKKVYAKFTWPRKGKKHSGSKPWVAELDSYRAHLNGNIAYILICRPFRSLQRKTKKKKEKKRRQQTVGGGNKTDPISKHGLKLLAITAWQCSCHVGCLLTSWIPSTSYSSQREIKVTSRADVCVLWRGQGQSPLWGFKNRCAAKGTKRWNKSFFPPYAASVDTLNAGRVTTWFTLCV